MDILPFKVQSERFCSPDDCFELKDGNHIPCLGFGTWKVFDSEHGEDVIAQAIAAGYRHFDAAAFYRSEKSVGQAIRQSGIKRDKFFITSKIWKDNLNEHDARASVKQSLLDLQTDYLDLLLIHWPKSSAQDLSWQERLSETWQTMIELKQEGVVKSIGVANFLPHHFAALHGESPVVDQIEFHAGYLQEEAYDYCMNRGILVEGWAALGRAELLNQHQIKAIAMAHGISPAQLCLKFCLKQGVLPLAKSANADRMRRNRELFSFDLTANEMHVLCNLPDKTAWSGEHPDYAIPSPR